MNRLHWVIPGVALSVVFAIPRAAGPAPAQQQAPAAQAKSPGPQQPVQEINDGFFAKFQKQIAGHEQEPAEKVFKNIQIPLLKTAPAGRLLLIMNLGYSRALGVACTHCHVESDFASDEKRPKRAAREMAAMHFAINQQLAKMQNLAPNPQGHFINCTTCHRGAIDPMAGSN
jgi:hypothetical protein